MISANQLKALRLIRAGAESDAVCRTLRLRRDRMRHLEAACRNVPDDILLWLEQALHANEKLRRLIAGLGPPDSGTPGEHADMQSR